MSDEGEPTPDYLRLLYEQQKVMRVEFHAHDAAADRRHDEVTAHLVSIESRLADGGARLGALEAAQAECDRKHRHHDEHHRTLEGRALAWVLGLLGTLVLFILSLLASGRLFGS